MNSTFKLNTYSKDRTCKLCYTQTSLSISQIGFSNSYAFSNRNKSRDKHNSLPKKDSIASSQSNSRVYYQQSSNMKSSYVDGNQKSDTKNNVRVDNYVSKDYDWMLNLKNDLCQICKINQSIITRQDKLKVCTSCYNKKT